MLETLDYYYHSSIRIGSTPTFSVYFDLYLYSAYAAHYVCAYTLGSMVCDTDQGCRNVNHYQTVNIHNTKYKMFRLLLIWKAKSNVSPTFFLKMVGEFISVVF